MVLLDGGLLDGAVHPFDLSFGPGMVDLGASVLDAVVTAPHVEHMGDEACRRSIGIARWKAELDAVFGEHGVDLARHGGDQSFQKG